MTPQLEHILVIGAGIGGLRTIEALRDAGYTGRITLVGEESHLPYDRPPLSKQVLAGEWEPVRTSLVSADVLERLGVETRLGLRAIRLHGRQTMLADGSTIDADAIVISTGLKARRIPGQTARFHTMRTLDDALALRRNLTDSRSLLVVGSGFIGTEIASTAIKLGVKVTIVESLSLPFERTLGVEIGGIFARLLTEGGVDLRCGATVAEFVEAESGVRVNLTDGTELRADVGVVGIGGTPDLGWLADSELTIENGVRCDSNGRALGAEHVWAVGDVASWHGPDLGQFTRSEHWNSTIDQAKVVAHGILGGPALTASESYFWSDQFGLKIQVLGHVGRSESVAELHGAGLSGGLIKKTVVGHFKDDTLVAVTGFGAPTLVARYRAAISGRYNSARVRELADSLEQPAASRA